MSATPSLSYDPTFSTEDPKTVRALFYGLGSMAPSAPTRIPIKLIGSETPNYAQGYFVYDSKKSGSMTTSHLRFGPNPIRSTYLITRASFVALPTISASLRRWTCWKRPCRARSSCSTRLIRRPRFGSICPSRRKQGMISKKIEFYVIDGYHGGAPGRNGHAHQHHHADLLLCH